MLLSRSIDFLLENAGDVIKYRLHKEILKDITKTEEENLLGKVMETPLFKVLQSYVKPNGYIGIGMHSWDKFKETPLQDGEAAARLLSNYAIPKDMDIVKNFAAALRDEDILQEEFSYYHPEVVRFENRFIGLPCGGGLMTTVYACQALMGWGDDLPYVKTSFNAFESMLHIGGLHEITRFNENSKKKYNYPYLEPDTYCPCQYHLETLAHTTSWRRDGAESIFADAVNHMCRIMKDNNEVSVKINGKYVGPGWAFVRPFRPFTADLSKEPHCRKTITHLAMAGGDKINVVRQSAENAMEAMAEDGILRVPFASAYEKKCFRDSMKYPTPYAEIGLEPEHRKDTALWCELTFWAVQLLSILEYV